MGALFSGNEILYCTHGFIASGGTGDQTGKLVWNLDDIGPGDWFLALFEDSHDQLSAAIERGAQGCIVHRRSRYPFAPRNATLIAVPDTKVALLELVRYWRYAVRPVVLGVVGSVGRRATIKVLHHLLRYGNFKCHVAFESGLGGSGCAGDVLSMPKGTDVLLFEAGALEKGDVARIAGALSPNIAVMARVQHPLPSPARDAHTAGLYCEILETINQSAVIYDMNLAVQERSRQVLNGLPAIFYSENYDSAPAFSDTEIIDCLSIRMSSLIQEPVTGVELWCAVEAARAIGLSSSRIDAALVLTDVAVEAN